MKELKLIKNNSGVKKEDIEWVAEFYKFLQGETPQGIHLNKEPKMTSEEAFSIVYYLQEHLPIFPDKIEVCDTCKDLFDSYAGGHYSEERGIHLCYTCDDGED